jgi:hypothetical protein
MTDISVLRASGTPPQNRTYAYAAGTGSAVVAVPAGAYLLTVALAGSLPTCAAQIAALDTVLVPVGGTWTHNVDGGIRGAVNVTITDSDSYFVDWVV